MPSKSDALSMRILSLVSLKLNNKDFDEQRFFDKVLQVTIELENKVKDDRVNRHEVALRDIYNSISYS
jgi:hypothetical protein